MFFALTDPKPDINGNYAVLPYIKGLTEPLTGILKRYDIRVTNKLLGTFKQKFPSPKDRPSTEKQTSVVYKIDCMDCSWYYIRETGRCFEKRKKEHMKNVKLRMTGSNIANHDFTHDHRIDFDNGHIIDKGNYRQRKTLESWHTAKTTNADNNSKRLPEQYTILLHK